jgi:hypothetical protein
MLFNQRAPRIDMIDTSSRMAMKMTCLHACRGNIEHARELYDFLSEGISEMPEYTLPPPTTMQQLTQSASKAFKWLHSNRSNIQGTVQFIQQLRSGGSVITSTAETAAEIAAAELPPLPNQ